MKRILPTLKVAMLTALLALPVLAIAQDQTGYDMCWYNGSSKVYYVEIPNKMFIQKSTNVTQDYLISLLDNQIEGTFQIGWMGDDMCKVIFDDSQIDNVIENLLKDDAVLTASHVYAFKEDYEKSLNNGSTDLESKELCMLNQIVCGIKGSYDKEQMDEIANSLGLSYEIPLVPLYVLFNAPKSVDMFEMAYKLNETGCFKYVQQNLISKIVLAYTVVDQICKDTEETVYYTLSGSKTDSPSGLTIVVTRYSDGSTKTEKLLFGK